MTLRRGGYLGLLLAAVCAWHGASPAGASAAVCAEVRLEIKQEAALEREAFDARLEINNNFPAYGLENFRVNVLVKDASGRTADGLFFVKVSSRQGINAVDGTGLVQPASTATVNWLIIPSAGAGGTNPLGLKYSVRADISYLLNGAAQSLSTFEDFITVKPQPELRLQYLLPFEVFADEPLTEDVIEPVEPFALGIRVVNAGYGPAADFRINSGQPEIVENKQGLVVDFKLLGTYVGRVRTADTLLVPFGTIPAGGVGQASWIMATSLSGRFTQFKATFTHSAELGGALTSLVRDVTTYTLVKDVLVDLPGRDGHFDFLVNTTTPRGAIEALLDAGGDVVPDLIFESDQPEPIAVLRASAELSGAPSASDPARTLRLTGGAAPGLWVYASAPVPDGTPLASVRRSDGRTLAPANAWISRHFNRSSKTYSYRLNILDYDVPESAEYRAGLALAAVDLPPSAVGNLSAAPGGGGAVALSWSAPGEDGYVGDMIGAGYLIQAEHDAGAVFGPANAQVKITTNTSPGAAQTYIVRGLAGNGEYHLRLWTQDTAGNISAVSNPAQAWAALNSPAGGSAAALSSDSVRTDWTIGNNWLPVGYQVVAATAPGAPHAFASPVYDLVVTSHIFSGLAPDTTYFFAGRAVNTDTLAVSTDAALGSAVTLAAAPAAPVFIVHYTSFTVAWSGEGNPPWTQYLVEISTAAEGLPVLASGGWAAGVERYFDGLSGDTTYHVRAKARNGAGVETASVNLGSLKTRLADILPPVTTIAFSGPVFGTDPVFISGLTGITLSALDDAAAPGDDLGSVAEVYYAVDADTFTVYAGTFTLSGDGVRTVSYYAVDAAGNAEAVKTSTVTVDNTAPSAGLEIAGTVFSSASVSYVVPAATVTLAAYDVASGVRELYYEVSGSTYSAAASSVTLALPEGMHTLSYSAADNLGNLSQVLVSSLAVDGTPPVSTATLAGLYSGGIYTSSVVVTLSADDALSGVLETRYSLNGGAELVYSGPFAVEEDGEYVLAFRSTDRTGNTETTRTLRFSILKAPSDADPPETVLAFGGVHYNDGSADFVSPSAGYLSLSSTDSASGVAGIYYLIDPSEEILLAGLGPATTPLFNIYVSTFSLPEGVRVVAYGAADLAGNFEALKTTTVYSDGTPPESWFEVDGSSGSDDLGNIVIAAGSAIRLEAEDPVAGGVSSGISLIMYEIVEHRAGAAILLSSGAYSAGFILSTGTYSLSFHARDHLGNVESGPSLGILVPLAVQGPGFSGVPLSTSAILWAWVELVDAEGYQVVTSTGGILSPVLPAGTTSYVQEALSANTRVDCFLRAYTSSGDVDSPLVAAATLAVLPGTVEVFDNGQNADFVLGQPDLFSSSPGLAANRLRMPRGVTVDPEGNVWVSDYANNRVLRFSNLSANGAAADLVIGQPDFVSDYGTSSADRLSHPAGIAFDQSGNLWVADEYCRIVRFSRPFSNGMSADLILGAADFTSYRQCTAAANRIQQLILGMRFDAGGRLWVADAWNHRVIAFSPPFTNGMNASIVLGQSDFVSSGYSYYLPQPNKLYSPMDIDFDSSGNAVIADTLNGRVLVFKEPFGNGMPADIVIGQADMFSSPATTGDRTPSQSRLVTPAALELDDFDGLYVADTLNNRIVKFSPPFSDGMAAALVLGQYDFNSGFNVNLSGSLSYPYDTALSGLVFSDEQNRLWVSDAGNNRVLMFKPVRSGVFRDIGRSSFTVRWLTEGNSPGTDYEVQIASDKEFASGPVLSSIVRVSDHGFTGLRGGSRYYARVRAINSLGNPTEWVSLHYTMTTPDPSTDFRGVPLSADSIRWEWGALPPGEKLQIFSSTGGVVSGVLPPGTTYFVQHGLAANTSYSNYLRNINIVGSANSLSANAVTFANPPRSVEPFQNGQGSEVVIGEADFNSVTWETSQSQLGGGSTALDRDGNLWVVDKSACRILRFSPPFFVGMAANVVIGQEDYSSSSCGISDRKLYLPEGIVFDKENALWVSDFANRILRFPAPVTSGKAADLVIGQTDFASSSYGTTAFKLKGPKGIAFGPDDDLWVADNNNNRVLRYSRPFASGMSADLVLGQTNFTSAARPFPGTEKTLAYPADVDFDVDGNLWVTDNYNNRILMFSLPFSTGMSASLAVGGSLTSGTHYCLPTEQGVCSPAAAAFDRDGDMYVADPGNQRVLKYNRPFHADMLPSAVLGQPEFNTKGAGLGRDRVGYVNGVTAGGSEHELMLWVSDGNNSRVLGFKQSGFSAVPLTGSDVMLAWRQNGNPEGTEYIAEASTSSDFADVVWIGGWSPATTAVAESLTADTTVYFSVKARNSVLTETSRKYLGRVAPPVAADIVTASTVAIDGIPEIVISAKTEMSVLLSDPGESSYNIALASAAADRLILASNLYEIGPEGDYNPPATLTFVYSTSTLAALGLAEEDIAVYEYFAGTGWVRLEGQVLDAATRRITVPITRIASLFGIFGVVSDRTPPVTSFTVTGSSWAVGWGLYVSAGSSVALSASDPVVYATSSGVAFTEFRVDAATPTAPFQPYSQPFALDGDGLRTIEFRSRDNAGNLEEIRTAFVYVDGTLPLTEALLAGTTGQNGWHVSPVTVMLVSTDALSGVVTIYYSLDGGETAVYTSSFAVAAEGPRSLAFHAVDNVGNIEPERTALFRIDMSTPEIAAVISPVPNAAGWNNTPVAVVFSGTDAVSGIAYCSSSFTMTAEGRDIPVSGYCADYAGWTSTASFALNIDTVAPVSSAGLSGTNGKNDWYISPVLLTLTSTDSLAGVAALYYSTSPESAALYSSPLSVASEGLHTYRYRTEDLAGNLEEWRFIAFAIDVSSPLVTAAITPQANPAGWHNLPPTVVFSGTDSVSGVAYCSPDMTIGAEGAGITLSGYCEDYAGLVSSASYTVSVDTTPPQVGYVLAPQPNAAGWHNTIVTAVFSGTDVLSGIGDCFSGEIDVEGKGLTLPGWCRDMAGNVGYSTATADIDMTPPGIVISSPSAGQVFIATRGKIEIGFAVSDNLDPAPVFGAFLVQTEDRGSPRGDRPAIIAVSTGQAIEPLDIDDGLWRLMVSATDFADNTAYLEGGVFEVIHDVLPPVSALAVTGAPRYEAGGLTYLTDITSMTLTSLDDLVEPLDGAGLGVRGQTVMVKSGDTAVKELAFVNSSPAQGEVLVSTFAFAGWSLPDGFYHLDYFAADVLDNIEAVRRSTVALDNTPPEASAVLAGTPGENGWHISTVTVSLSAEDGLSGVAGTFYRLDGKPESGFAAYTAAFDVAGEGEHSLLFYAADNLGNAGSPSERAFRLDLTPPLVSESVSPAANEAGWHNSTVSVVFSGTDAVSGVSYCEPEKTAFSEGRDIKVSGYCRDFAGLSSTATARLNIDPTSPTITADRLPAANKYGWNNSDVTARFYCSDALSGIKSCPDEVLLFNEGADQGTGGVAYDHAGNSSSAAVSGINIDRAAPKSSLSVSGDVLQDADKRYISLRTGITLAASDPVSGGTASGVETIEYRIDAEPFLVYTSSFSLAEGVRVVAHRAHDKAWNTEAPKSAVFHVDATPPVTSFSVDGARYDANRFVYITKDSALLLSPDDPVSNEVAGGVLLTKYRLDGGAWAVYTGSFTIVAEGRHTLEYLSLDRVNNTEAVKTTELVVDNTPPEASAVLAGTPGENGWHISTVTVSLSAEDGLSGVAGTFYRLDGKPESGFAAYTAAFDTAGEGEHSLLFYAADNLGNAGSPSERAFRLDLTPPLVSERVSPAANEAGWHNSTVSVVFSGTDAVSGVSYCEPEKTASAEGRDMEVSGYCRDFAGLSSTATARLNIDLTSPTVRIERAPSANAHGWNNSDVAASFICGDALSGVKACPPDVIFASEGADQGASGAAFDYADNRSSAAISGINLDKTPPVSTLSASGDVWSTAGNTYLSLRSVITLSAVDPVSGGTASGVEGVDYYVDPGAFDIYSSTFGLSEGVRTVHYRARDNAGNIETARATEFLVDNTAPVTTHNIGSPYYADGGVNYITPATPVGFTAADLVVGEVASGVSRIEVSIDGGSFAVYSAALKFAEGRHTIKYRAMDNVGNVEAEKTLAVQSDNTPPVSRWVVSSGANIELDGRFYLNAAGKIALESADPAVNGVASGVEGIYYGVDAAPGVQYSAPFGLAEGVRTLNYGGRDNVANAEVVRSTVIYADGSAPVSELSVSGDQYRGAGLYVSSRSLVVIAAADPVIGGVASGVRDTLYAVDGGVFAVYSPFSLTGEGRRTVAFYSSDRVDNVEKARTSGLLVDGTPPATAFSVAGARYDADGLIYITKDSGLLLSVDDPVSNEVASGVLMTRYRIDGGVWTVYTGSFTITAEGRHTLEYLSLDRVNNTEAVKLVELAVDNTPPVSSISLGEPKFTAFGLSVLTPATPVALSAYDPVAGEVASGLGGISYELVPYGASSGERRSYLEPFTLPQGAWEVRFWSDDKVGNTEPMKSVVLAVSTLQRDALASVTGLAATGNSDIAGAVRSNGEVSVAGSARILGDVTAAAITLTGKKAEITGVRTESSGTLSPEPIPLTLIENFVTAAGDEVNAGVPERYLVDGRLVVGEQAELVLATGTYRFAGIELAGGCAVRAGGPVDILVEGDIVISGGSGLNAEGPASRMKIFLNKASTVTFAGGGKVAAYFYAPYAHLELSGNALLGGHYFAGSSSVSGNGNIVQAGESLPEPAPLTAGDKSRTSGFTTADASYGVLAGPDAAFRLGEVYVFPNPALRGAAPTFHFECGVADSVNIKIYTTSGRFAHETTLTGMPVALDDGNGLAYAYEYAWREHIPSGVYYYLIEASKAGQKMKKTGKFAVVR
ncbi:MAG: hypothetical protein RDU13_03115 [Elusimicrobiales bacterium]|nr:hypothetical protein [Elusimicrobiales bacterium]